MAAFLDHNIDDNFLVQLRVNPVLVMTFHQAHLKYGPAST